MADLGIKGLKFTSSPHISYGERPCDLMRLVIVSLIPIAVYGVMLFGLDALLKIIVSVACAIGFEALFQYLTKQQIQGLYLPWHYRLHVHSGRLFLEFSLALLLLKDFLEGLGQTFTILHLQDVHFCL